MSDSPNNNFKKSLNLFELNNQLDFLIHLYSSSKFPKVLMLSGAKGYGKSTMVNHFLNFVYDKDSYDSKKNIINEDSYFYKQFLNNTFSNIIFLSGEDFKNLKVDKIRELKSILSKSTILDKERFIILDDVELFNTSSLNALLKIIEEPTHKNFFILINNKTRPLIETIKSRSLELKIILNEKKRLNIIASLIKLYELQDSFDYSSINLSKNINLINLIIFITEYFFYKQKQKKIINIDQVIDKKNFVLKNINKFVLYNLNQNSLISAINNKLFNE